MVEVGDRVALGDWQGTVQSVEFHQAYVAWDDTNESCVSEWYTSLTPLPPFPAGLLVKHKWNTGLVGQMADTPTRGERYGVVRWNNGLTVKVELVRLAPLQPQKPQGDERTLEATLVELRDEIDKWRRTEREVAEQVRVLTDRAQFLLDAQRHRELARSIQKW